MLCFSFEDRKSFSSTRLRNDSDKGTIIIMKMFKIPFVCTAFFLTLTSLLLVCNDAMGLDAATYSIKGVVKALPGNGRAANEVIIQHEAVPDYRNRSGEIVGMSAMTMPFYLRRDVSLGDIKVGDSVEFQVEAHFEPRFTEEVASIKKAP